VNVLFTALHHAHFRNFESVVRELAARGHRVHLAGDEEEALGGRQLAERLAAECPGVTWDLLPRLEEEPWYETARKLRLGLDYVRVLEPPYTASPKLRIRARERAPRIVRWTASVPWIGPAATRAALKGLERITPRSELLEAYLRRHQPDVVVLASLTYSRSQQLDLLKAARGRRIPVAAAIMSWDHLSSKGLLHVAPDRVIVWNDVQRREAVEMHGLPTDRIVATGAQCYDEWFARQPARSRDAFCQAVGLDPARPFVLWVHSALSPTPDPPEPVLVRRWIGALRQSDDVRLRGLGVLVRPHPERIKEWAGVSLDGLENVAFHGRNPIDAEAKHDYFDSLYHSSAVVGLVTSAFLEAAIVGRPVLTFTLPEYRSHQEEMLHFRYLTDVEGGLLHRASSIEEHLGQLAAALALGGRRDERNERFLRAFVRPRGLEHRATPAFVDALEALHRAGPQPDPALPRVPWLSPVIHAGVAAGRTRVGHWLLNEPREDEWDSQRRWEEQTVRARIRAKTERQDAKVRRKAQRQRRDAWMRRGKEVKSAMRKMRHRTAVTVYRGLYIAGLWRGELPGSTGKD
jgi:hypothetical protein